MMEKCKALFRKYREIIIYVIVGCMTTVVSWGACFVAELFLDADISWQNFLINSIGWVVGVTFSYPLNRQWVFRSKNPRVLKEFFGFAVSRLSTWVLDVAVMWVTVNLCHMNYWIAKIFISAVLVTVTNYVFSKVFIFKKKEE